jgi:hypothetical protein
MIVYPAAVSNGFLSREQQINSTLNQCEQAQNGSHWQEFVPHALNAMPDDGRWPSRFTHPPHRTARPEALDET